MKSQKSKNQNEYRKTCIVHIFAKIEINYSCTFRAVKKVINM